MAACVISWLLLIVKTIHVKGSEELFFPIPSCFLFSFSFLPCPPLRHEEDKPLRRPLITKALQFLETTLRIRFHRPYPFSYTAAERNCNRTRRLQVESWYQ